MTGNQHLRWVAKPAIWFLALLPVAWLVWSIAQKTLGPNPAETIDRFLGYWALVLLWITLMITPIRLLTGWVSLSRFRRLLGLFSFFYAVLHLASYIVINQFFDWAAIWEDILKRTYIMFGVAGFFILALLAKTSTANMVKRLGGQNWKRLHQCVYLAATLVAIHFIMIRKGFQLEPLIYAGFLFLLLMSRLLLRRKRKVTSPKS